MNNDTVKAIVQKEPERLVVFYVKIGDLWDDDYKV